MSLFSANSLQSFCTRSSSWPLYIVPLVKSVVLKLRTLLCFNSSATFPVAILCARSSTTAVFPAPGSPNRIALFFFLQHKISHTWLISLSLPITGSYSPLNAFLVMSSENSSSVGVFEFGSISLVDIAPRSPAFSNSSSSSSLSRLISFSLSGDAIPSISST